MKRKTCLNNGWQFLEKEYSEENLQCPDGEYMPVRLPHDYLIYDVRNLYRDSVGWYRRKLMYVPDGLERVLFFEGIYMDSEVFVNGRSAGTWKYGYSSFEVDITPYLEAGENELLVRVVHRSPNSRWYSGAGIYRSVYLIERESTHIEPFGLYITPVKRAASDIWDVEVEVEAVHGADDEKPFDSIRYIITQKNGKHDMQSNEEDSLCIIFNQLIGEKSNIYRHTFEITAPKLWDIYCGNLYELKAELIKEGEVFDYEQSVFGFRTIEIDSNKGFLLNGRHVKIKGSCEHHGFGCLGAAVNKSAVRRKLEGLKRMGVNAIRTAHNMPSVEFMELADEMGFLVDSEAFDMWGHTKTKYDYGRFFAESAKKDVESWIRRDRNHPSIIMWSVGNEIYDMHAGDEGLAELVMLLGEVKKHDPKKHAFTTFASNYMRWENTQKCAGLVDAVGYNYGEYLYEEHHAKHPDWVIYGSETSSMLASRGVYHFPIETSTLCDTDEQCSALGNCSAGWGAHSYTDNIIADRDAGFSLGQFIWAGVDYFGEPTPYHTRNSYFGQMDTAGFEKDSYYIYQAEWTSFKENPMVHVFPYWDFNPGQLVDVCVCSNAPIVELFVNGKSKGFGRQDYRFLFTFDSVQWEKGTIEAISYDEQHKELSRHSFQTVGEPERLKLTLMHGPQGVFADGADIAMVQVEVVDDNGERCPLANHKIKFDLQGPAEWRGGIAQAADNYVLAKELPVECGITRVMIRSTTQPGNVVLKVAAEGLASEEIAFSTRPVEVKNGLSTFFPSVGLPSRFDRGETPSSPSYKETKVDVRVADVTAGTNQRDAGKSFDDNELSEWKNDGRLNTAWITYKLERRAEIDDICIKLTGWRQRSYPLEVYAGEHLIWSGNTEKSLGYVHLMIDRPVRSDEITIRLKGATQDSDAFGQIIEVVEPKAGELDLFKAEGGKKVHNELRIVEVEFLETLNQ